MKFIFIGRLLEQYVAVITVGKKIEDTYKNDEKAEVTHTFSMLHFSVDFRLTATAMLPDY